MTGPREIPLAVSGATPYLACSECGKRSFDLRRLGMRHKGVRLCNGTYRLYSSAPLDEPVPE